MFTYGIGESAERKEMKRPSRLRIIGAHIARAYNRADAWLNEHIVSVTISMGSLWVAIALAIAVFNGEQTIGGKALALFACALLGAIGVAFVSIGSSEWSANNERAIARKSLARARRLLSESDNAHELALGAISKQLLDTTRALVDSTNEISKVKLGAHNLAWALVEDTDIREMTAYKLSEISRDIFANERAQVFAELVLRDYTLNGIYAHK